MRKSVPFMNPALAKTVIESLSSGRALTSLGLGEIAGRLDLRGLVMATPASTPLQPPFDGVSRLPATVDVRDTTWNRLDFTGSHLSTLRTFGVRISDCVFDHCKVDDWRIWDTQFTNCTFTGADLRELVWASIYEGKRNVFKNVRFINCKLARANFGASEFVDCVFSNAGLRRTDFDVSRHVRTRFEGVLDDCQFYRRDSFESGGQNWTIEPNEMEHVDFSRATLKFVRFGHFDMGTVRWPTDENHVMLEPFKDVLDRLLELLQGREDVTARVLQASIEDMRKWAGPHQERGVFCRAELESPEEAALFDAILAAARPN